MKRIFFFISLLLKYPYNYNIKFKILFHMNIYYNYIDGILELNKEEETEK